MKIVVAGGTGFIGRALVKALRTRGDEVWVVSRTAQSSPLDDKVHAITWQTLEQQPEQFEALDAIINLAGETINQRWTTSAKQRIIASRVTSARQIATLVERLQHKPRVVINSSGVSIYGTSETLSFTEQDKAAVTDFLTETAVQWEAAADQIKVDRLIKLRTSVVLGNHGGAFPQMSLPYRLFGGGPVGSGRQWLSWIHVDDLVRTILFCIDNDQIHGPVNASAPEPVTNDQFGRTLGRVIHRPHWMPVPSFMMKLVFGEMSTLLLDGQRVLPAKLLEHGFQFEHPTLVSALTQLAQSK